MWCKEKRWTCARRDRSKCRQSSRVVSIDLGLCGRHPGRRKDPALEPFHHGCRQLHIGRRQQQQQ